METLFAQYVLLRWSVVWPDRA